MEWIYKIWMDIGYWEGAVLTLWLVGLYWGKKRLDFHFARRTQRVMEKSIYNVKIVEDIQERGLRAKTPKNSKGL